MPAELVSFQLQVGTGNQTITLSNASLVPNLIMFWSICNASADAFVVTGMFSFGAASATGGSETGCVFGFMEDNLGDSNTFVFQSNTKCFLATNNAGTVLQDFSLQSFGTGQFTISISTTDGVQRRVHALCLEINDAFVTTADSPTTVTTQDYTGFGFQPTGLIAANAGNATGSKIDNLVLNLGMASGAGATEEAALSISSADAAAASNSDRRHNSDGLIQRHLNGSITMEANLDSFLSDGVRLNFTTAPAVAQKLLLIGLKGNVKVLSYDHPTSTGSQAYTGAGFAPEAVIEMTADVTSTDAFADSARLCIGAATGASNEGAVWIGDEDAQDPTDADRRYDTDATVVYADHGTPTIRAEANLTSLDSDGHTLNWSVAAAGPVKGMRMWVGKTAAVGTRRRGHIVGGGLFYGGAA